MDGRTEEWTDGWTDGGWIDGWMDEARTADG